MSDRVAVLDHGYLEFIEGWGSDERIIEAARMSTGKGFLGWEPGECPSCEGAGSTDGSPCYGCEGKGQIRGDKFLLATLFNNNPKHTTPFEMAGMVIEISAPIMVYREWHRHRTQSYNEMSGRYTALPDVNYIPSIERLMIGSDGKNKQAGTIVGTGVLTENQASAFQEKLKGQYAEQQKLYEWALLAGVPKELARVHLPVGRYSRMRASANLLNWLKFLTLRMDEKAQWEIRQYANEVGNLIAAKFPRTWSLFVEGRQTYSKKNG